MACGINCFPMLWRRTQGDQGGAPGACVFAGKPVGGNKVQPVQDGVDGPAQGACSLAVNNPDLKNTGLAAFLQVVGHEKFYVGGPEGVEVQGAVNGQRVRVVIHHAGG